MPFLAGEILTAANLNNNLDRAVVIKAADQTVNNSAALQNDTHLVLPVVANAKYWMYLGAVQNSNATANFKIDFTAPAATTWHFGFFDFGSSAANEQFGITNSLGAVAGITGAAANSVCQVTGWFVTGANAGNLQFRWAQDTANVSNTIVRAGSILLLLRLP